MRYKILILILFFFLCISLPIFFYIYDLNENLFKKIISFDASIKEIIKNNYIFILIIFFIVNFTTTAVNMPGGSLKCIIAGYYFGLFYGLMVSLLPITLGSYFVYYFNTTLVSQIQVTKFKKIINYLNEKYKAHSFLVLVFVRLVLFIPLSIQNLFLSSLKINKQLFLITTMIGLFPTIFVYNLIGSLVDSMIEFESIKISILKESNILPVFFILIILVFSFTIILSKFKKKFK